MANYEVFEVCAEDVTMKVNRFGRGKKPFVIIPGLSLTPVSQSAASVYGAYLKACDEYTVYVFDRKLNPEEGYTVRQMAADTAKIMKKLGLENAYAFGASQGGMILQFLMIDYPELIKKAVIGSSMARETKEAREVIGRWIGLAASHEKRALNHLCFEKIYSEEFLEKYKKALPILEENGTEADCDNFVILARACDGFNAYDELYKVKCTVLVLGAGADKVVSPQGSREIAGKISGSELYIYEGASHSVYDEAPDYLDRILSFFER